MLPNKQRAMANRHCYPWILKIWSGESEVSLRQLAVKCRVPAICVVAFFTCAGSARQRDDDAPFATAVKAFNSGRFEDAERLANAAQKANPKKPDIANLLGAIYARQKHYEEAEEQFDSALALDPNFYQAKLNL